MLALHVILTPISYLLSAHNAENNYIWPFTHNGTQLPMNGFLRQLPTSLGGLKDDPYRSLAAILREADGFEKVRCCLSFIGCHFLL